MVNNISNQIKKTEEMKRYEEETGKNAVWRKNITESFKKWQRGEKNYNVSKDRISLYVPEGLKNEWVKFAEENNYSTLSKLIRDALRFFIKQGSKGKRNIDIDFLSGLSHDLKDPLTSLKAYLQLIIEQYGASFEENLLNILTNAFNQCSNLEKIIIENLDLVEDEKGEKELNEERIKKKITPDILLIEDDLEIGKVLNSFFSSRGYSLTMVTEGRNGLKEIFNNPPKIILLDIILPDISGYEVIKSIKASKKHENIPIFFLTAIPRVEALKKTKELSATGLILKPFNLKDFDVIYEYLDGKVEDI
jgi:CheY-like chemotaxis protein